LKMENEKEIIRKLPCKLYDKLLSCKTAPEVIATVKAQGIELTPEQANEILGAVSSGELSDEQLNKISGCGYVIVEPDVP